MNKNVMSARRLQIILSIAIVAGIAAVAGGFMFAHNNLTKYAAAISQLNADADTGDQSINTLLQIEERLDNEQDTIAAAQSIITDNTTFAETVVAQVTKIAAESGVSISSVEYVDTPSTATGSTPVAAPASTPAATPSPTAPQPSTANVPAGVTKKSISVSLQSPVSYDNIMKFIAKVESNDLKLQIATVNLTKDDNGLVATQSFSIGAFVR